MKDCLIYSVGTGLIIQNKDIENIPEKAEAVLKVKNGEIFSLTEGKWHRLDYLSDSHLENQADREHNLPESPIDVASMLINTTVECEPPKEGLALSPLLEPKPYEIPKYDILQLEEIAKHLLLYCEIQRRGCGDGNCKESNP